MFLFIGSTWLLVTCGVIHRWGWRRFEHCIFILLFLVTPFSVFSVYPIPTLLFRDISLTFAKDTMGAHAGIALMEYTLGKQWLFSFLFSLVTCLSLLLFLAFHSPVYNHKQCDRLAFGAAFTYIFTIFSWLSTFSPSLRGREQKGGMEREGRSGVASISCAQRVQDGWMSAV